MVTDTWAPLSGWIKLWVPRMSVSKDSVQTPLCFGFCGFTSTQLLLEKINQSKTIETMKFHMTANKVIIHQCRLVEKWIWYLQWFGNLWKSVYHIFALCCRPNITQSTLTVILVARVLTVLNDSVPLLWVIILNYTHKNKTANSGKSSSLLKEFWPTPLFSKCVLSTHKVPGTVRQWR